MDPPHHNTNHAAQEKSKAVMASASAGAARARTVLAAAMSKYAETSEVVTEKLTNKRALYVRTNIMAGLATAMAVIPEAVSRGGRVDSDASSTLGPHRTAPHPILPHPIPHHIPTPTPSSPTARRCSL